MPESDPSFDRYAWAGAWNDPAIVAEAMNDLPHPAIEHWCQALQGQVGVVVDLGTGLGRNLIPLLREGYAAIGLDIASAGLWRLHERLEALDLPPMLVEADMFRLPFASATCDWIIAFQVLHHERAAAISDLFVEIRRVLHPGGYFLFDLLATGTPGHQHRRQQVADGLAREIEPETFITESALLGGKPLPHHYSSRRELDALLAGFAPVEIHVPAEQSYATNHWVVMARKVVGQIDNART